MRFLSRIRVNPDSIADAIGALAVFAALALALWLAFGIGLPTGGDELMGRV